MKPAAFDYVRADTADEAVRLLAEHGDEARVLAGGQSLMAVLNMRLAQPGLLIDISRSDAMAAVAVDAGQLRIGAAATQASVEWRAALATEVPLLALAFPHISHFQIRNKGTVCGSIAHADPSAELPLCLLALRGDVALRSAKKRRTVAAADFFTGMLSTVRAGDELLESVHFPIAKAGQRFGFAEFSIRHGDYAVCAAAAVVDDAGTRITIGGIADRPTARDWTAADVADDAKLDDALNEFAWALDAQDDPHMSATARRHLVRRLGRQAIAQARGRVPSPSTKGKTT
jgi:2-furoyl-CoA dehydrogenase FAD binding subunit